MAQPNIPLPILRLPALLMAAALSAGPAFAQQASPTGAPPQDREAPPITYPAAQDEATLSAWLRKETDIDPASVVAVTPDALLAILQSRVVDGALAVIVRGETLTPQATAQTKVASWHTTVQVDCAGGRIRLGVTTGYSARNLLFDGAPIRPADAAWSKPVAGNPLDRVRQAACDKAFRGPLADGAAVPTLETPSAEPAPGPLPTIEAPKAEPPRAEPLKPAAPQPPAAPPAPTAPAPRAGSANVSVQIAAAGSEAEAAGLLARLRKRNGEAMSGLDTRIVQASVKGRPVFRALVVGFADRAAAVRFCMGLKASKQACFVRADQG